MWPAALMQEHVDGAKLCCDRDAMLEYLSLSRGSRIAEIGVAFGDFSKKLIDCLEPSLFDAFDVFTLHESPVVWGQLTHTALNGKTHLQFFRDRFAVEIESGRMRVFQCDGAEGLSKQPEAFYDLIYIDANHTIDFVRRDADAASRVLKQSGLMIFNDYIMYDHIAKMPYGVVQVVNDLCVYHDWMITHFALHQAMFCDVVLKRRTVPKS